MIIKNIIELIKKEGFVYVNDLGLFKKVFHEAQDQNGQWIPPHNEITFHEDTSGNGFALMLMIANNEHISMSSADEAIRKWAADIKQQINDTNGAKIDHFGLFSTENGKIIFHEDNIPELNTEFEGMEPILEKRRSEQKQINVAEISAAEIFDNPQSTTITTEPTADNIATEKGENEPIEETTQEASKTNIEVPVTATIEVNEPQGEAPESVIPADIAEEKGEDETQENIADQETLSEEENATEEEEENITDKKKTSAGWIILIIIAIIATAAVYYFRNDIKGLYKQWQDSRNITIIDTIEQSIEYADTTVLEEENYIESEQSSTAEQNIAETDKNTVPAATSNTTTSKEYPEINYESGKFYVIAGSFTTSKDAQQHIRNHNLGAYNPKILRQEGNDRVRVCIGIYTSESDAQAFASTAKISNWILK